VGPGNARQQFLGAQERRSPAFLLTLTTERGYPTSHCDDAAAAACYLFTVAATDCACAVHCRLELLSNGVTMDDVSVCVVRKSKMFIVLRVVPFDNGNNLSSTVM